MRAWYFFRDDVLLGTQKLRAKFIEMLAQAADSKNDQVWLDYVLREMINLIYGDEVLHQAD
jgi:hypothetical protein